MQEQVFIFYKSEAESLGAVRCRHGLLAAGHDGHVWLRGILDTDEQHTLSLRKLPAYKTFFLDENDLLFTPGSLTPVRKLPLLDWVPLQQFISCEIPVAALPGKTDILTDIQLEPTTAPRPAGALRVALGLWKAWAEAAPATRLHRLTFAVNEHNEVLILGTPLPPLPGNEYYVDNDILLPAGYRLKVSLMADFVREKHNGAKDVVLLFECDGSFQKIDKLFFVTARRNAVRLTRINDNSIK